ncbi:Rer1 family protein [Schizosaccharomyces japonicus yFS275]|uniref:Protein RER1 n=1 Tax=Schizosaccharomyces japonicus (strain yFS275 / FY16936) TaxID=402676 RepID=B6K6R4_SCHJY|nr:Rer1 family protein [Schizosaccharomyces japonicus yFS275]EEB09218.1 Rer1 family protein [Schizosaccharomyces japonicus yFS275]
MEAIKQKILTVREHASLVVRTYRHWVDMTIPYRKRRWAAQTALLCLFFFRIFYVKGWYIVCYTLGIYLLNLFLAFLTPKFDPSLEQAMLEEETEEGLLPTSKDDEFRPFIRRLPEFKFWYASIKATSIAMITTFFRIFDVPVFWPILVMYYIVLSFFCFRRQIQHMIKYRYVPFDFGKKRFGSK